MYYINALSILLYKCTVIYLAILQFVLLQKVTIINFLSTVWLVDQEIVTF